MVMKGILNHVPVPAHGFIAYSMMGARGECWNSSASCLARGLSFVKIRRWDIQYNVQDGLNR